MQIQDDLISNAFTNRLLFCFIIEVSLKSPPSWTMSLWFSIIIILQGRELSSHERTFWMLYNIRKKQFQTLYIIVCFWQYIIIFGWLYYMILYYIYIVMLRHFLDTKIPLFTRPEGSSTSGKHSLLKFRYATSPRKPHTHVTYTTHYINYNNNIIS